MRRRRRRLEGGLDERMNGKIGPLLEHHGNSGQDLSYLDFLFLSIDIVYLGFFFFFLLNTGHISLFLLIFVPFNFLSLFAVDLKIESLFTLDLKILNQ